MSHAPSKSGRHHAGNNDRNPNTSFAELVIMWSITDLCWVRRGLLLPAPYNHYSQTGSIMVRNPHSSQPDAPLCLVQHQLGLNLPGRRCIINVLQTQNRQLAGKLDRNRMKRHRKNTKHREILRQSQLVQSGPETFWIFPSPFWRQEALPHTNVYLAGGPRLPLLHTTVSWSWDAKLSNTWSPVRHGTQPHEYHTWTRGLSTPFSGGNEASLDSYGTNITTLRIRVVPVCNI